MKIFTVQEANELLPAVRLILQKIQKHHAAVQNLRETAKTAANSAQFGGGGMESGSLYVNSLYEIGKLTAELDNLGIQIKDYERGLIDFPAMRGGRLVLLCWQLGEGDEIEYWHDVDAGFNGRQKL